ncbi:MAG: ATP synthase subunit I [Desulfobacteraceae bacterium]|nr:ATP synthase subunit I [Desulfobacteraceae bacterium]
MIIQKRILKFVLFANWILLVIATVAGFAVFSADAGIGVLTGALIVTINFHFLVKTLKKALTPPHITPIKGIIIKYYIRFFVTGVILFVLIVKNLVNPFALIAGLSVIVVSMMLAAVNECRQLLLKEAR